MNKSNSNLIVLIDSDVELHKALQKILEKLNIIIMQSSNGSDGLQMLRGDIQPAVILIADNLRDTTTSELVPTIRKLHQFSLLGIITNDFNNILIDACKKEGITEFFFRPLNIGQLIIRLKNMLQKHSEIAQRTAISQKETVQARGLRLEAETFFTIKDISESGCCLRSPFELQENDILVLTCTDLSHKLSIDESTSYPFRVAKSKQAETGKYFDVGGQFIGLPPDIKNKLRRACLSVKGFKASRSN